MTKLVDVTDLKSVAFGCAGSSPAAGTTHLKLLGLCPCGSPPAVHTTAAENFSD
jgi:hypothetical protein